MGKIVQFEDLLCWQKARELANLVYELSEEKAWSRDRDLQRQIRRAASSVMHNIAEGFDAGSDAEFARFLRIARRSASEVQSQLHLSRDRSYITEEQRRRAHQLAVEVKRLLNGLLGYLGRPSGQRTLKDSTENHGQQYQVQSRRVATGSPLLG